MKRKSLKRFWLVGQLRRHWVADHEIVPRKMNNFSVLRQINKHVEGVKALIWRCLPFSVFLFISILILGEALSPGYILQLDMAYGPQSSNLIFREYLYGIGGNESNAGGSPTIQVVFALITWCLDALVPMWAVQKFWLLLLLTTAGISMYSVIPTDSRSGKYIGAILYLVNPFMAVRLLAGHFFIIWGLAFLPKVFQLIVRWPCDRGYRSAFSLAVWLSILAGSLHFFYLALALLSLVILTRLITDGERWLMIRRSLLVFGILVALNLGFFWSLFFETGQLVATAESSRSSISDLMRSVSREGVLLLELAALHGFWHEIGADVERVFGWQFIVIGLIGFTLYGVLDVIGKSRNGMTHALVAFLAIFSLVVAGAHSLKFDIYSWIFDIVPFFELFRDSHKLVGVAVFVYAFYGGVGCGALLSKMRKMYSFRRFYIPELVTGILLILIVYNTAGLFSPPGNYFFNRTYPDTYVEAERILSQRQGTESVVFFPWHGYMSFGWAGNSTTNLAPGYFSGIVLAGDTIEVGSLYSASTSTASGFIQTLLDPMLSGVTFSLADDLQKVNASHVVLLKESDFPRYQNALDDQLNLKQVLDNQNLTIYNIESHGTVATSVSFSSTFDKFRLIPWHTVSLLLWALIFFYLRSPITVKSFRDWTKARIGSE